MNPLQRTVRRPAQASAWLLALAVLLSVGWGQVHRVLHAGLPTPFATAQAASIATATALASPAAAALTASTALGLVDEEGSSLCQLLDQLALGAGATTVAASAVQPVPPFLQPALAPQPLRWASARRFDARGPPAAA